MATRGNTRLQLLDATITVIARDGLRAATHRKIAQAAGVSLSATSYHFTSIDDMLFTAMTRAVTLGLERDTRRFASVASEHEFVEAVLATIAVAESGSEAAILRAELYAQAARDSDYRALAQRRSESLHTRFAAFIGDAAGARLGTFVEGAILLRSVDGPLPRDEAVREAVRDIVRGHAPADWRAAARATPAPAPAR